MKTYRWVLVATALVACGKKDEAKTEKTEKADPPPAKTEPAPVVAKAPNPQGKADVTVTVSGAIEKSLSGAKGSCTAPVIEAKPAGATYQVSLGDEALTIVATNEAELKSPQIVLTAAGKVYERTNAAPTVKLDPGKSAEIDADLGTADKKSFLHVKATFTCN